jgi:hypothetical protein
VELEPSNVTSWSMTGLAGANVYAAVGASAAVAVRVDVGVGAGDGRGVELGGGAGADAGLGVRLGNGFRFCHGSRDGTTVADVTTMLRTAVELRSPRLERVRRIAFRPAVENDFRSTLPAPSRTFFPPVTSSHRNPQRAHFDATNLTASPSRGG